MNRTPLSELFVCVVLAACSSSRSPREQSATPSGTPTVVAVGGDVLATVDGVPITRADLELATSSGPSPHGGPAPRSDALLEHIVQQEVLAQRALAAHLDRDADYREELAPREAQLAAWKRERLSNLYAQREENLHPQIGEAGGRQYYDANAVRIRTEVRVGQILLRDEARALQALQDLRAGATFDSVAVRQFPVVPDLANKPWELAFLQWNQLPEQWVPIIDGLAVGQISDVIRGPNGRFWIIKVLERRENPALTFEATRPLITALLQERAVASARERLYREARESAHIVYAHAPRPAAPAPTPSAPEPTP